MATCTNLPRATVPSNLPLCGRYARGKLSLDHGGELQWTPGVGCRPAMYLHDTGTLVTLAQLQQHIFYVGAPRTPVLVQDVPTPNAVWELFPPGSMCGLATPNARGTYAVWCMPLARAATLRRLADIGAAMQAMQPHIFLTVSRQPGIVTAEPRPACSYLELTL